MLKCVLVLPICIAFGQSACATVFDDPAPQESPTVKNDGWSRWQEDARKALPVVEEVTAKILEELQKLPNRTDLPADHWARRWAGEYNHPPGSMVSYRICIAPDNGVTCTWAGCFGVEDANHGSITGTFDEDSDGRLDGIIVKWSHPPRPDRSELNERLYFVEWKGADGGIGRQLLIRESQMLDFVNMYNQGGFMRWDTPGFIEKQSINPTRRGFDTSSKPATDVPQLPKAWMDKLIAFPLDATITSVNKASIFTLDRGSIDGIYVGMKINISPDWKTRELVVEKVLDHTSECHYFGTLNQPPPSVGEKFRVAAGRDGVVAPVIPSK